MTQEQRSAIMNALDSIVETKQYEPPMAEMVEETILIAPYSIIGKTGYFCENCRTRVSPIDHFCRHCGCKLYRKPKEEEV